MADDLPDIPRIAAQFQSEWDSGQIPSLADWLSRFPDAMRQQLAESLLSVDLENRLRRGMSADAGDYQQLGEDIQPIVAAVLQRSGDDVAATLDITKGKSSGQLSHGSTVGPYRLLRLLGQGGMGEVWMAEQSKPVKRRVALKLIKKGLASQEVLVRFEAERQALALMNHPNIARILDIGATLDGRPWFSMELVQGQPITAYCDQNRLNVDQRLKLLADTCSGLQHAHQKGIIHRDLKPTNILVSVQDGQAVPKIIDFGLAKAMESTQRLTDQSLFTGIGQILGTLKYMSPEQASLDNLDIDTRTDIYAMGVVLYELLTGGTPLDDDSLKSQALMKVLSMIRELEPIKPSSKLNCSSQEAQSVITGQRKTDSLSLRRVLEGDLDWIVMKALEKDRTRRYESASGFAADIRRYLNSEPVVARPPSVGYRVRKFVRKNRLAVTAASLVLLALLIGTAGSTFGMLQAISARKDAEQNLAYAKKGNEILGSVFSGLDPKAEFTTVAELRKALSDNLENAASLLDESTIGDPLAVAEMQDTLGLSLLGLGEHTSAIERFERARDARLDLLGPEDPSTLLSTINLALGLEQIGQWEQALLLYDEAVPLLKDKLGDNHEKTLVAVHNMAMCYESIGQVDKALPLLEENLELTRAQLGPNHFDTLQSMNNLAMSYKSAGLLDKALPLMEELLTACKAHLPQGHLLSLTVAHNLALTLSSAGQLEKAKLLWEETVDKSKEKLGVENPTTLSMMSSLAGCYESMGQIDRALELIEVTLKLMQAKFGSEHPSTLQTMNALAGISLSAGQTERALRLFEETVNLQEAIFGPDHPSTLTSRNDLASGYFHTNQIDKAVVHWEETLRQRRRQVAPDHPEVLTFMSNLATGYKVLGQLDKAISLFHETIALMKNKLGRSHPKTLAAMNNLSMAYKAAGQLDKALPLLEETLELRKSTLGPDHPETINGMLNHGAICSAAGKGEQASTVLREFIHAKRRNLSPNEPPIENWLITASMYLLNCKEFSTAEPMLKEALEIRQQKESDVWTTFNTMSLLGAALLGQQKYDQAEPLLIDGYEGMQARRAQIPPEGAVRIPQAIDRLIELFTALGKSEELAQWHAARQSAVESTPEN